MRHRIKSIEDRSFGNIKVAQLTTAALAAILKFEFDFNSDIKIASKIIEVFNQEIPTLSVLATAPKKNIEVNPDGKYYALLIGNAKYDKWASLCSPVNYVNEIHKVLKKKLKVFWVLAQHLNF